MAFRTRKRIGRSILHSHRFPEQHVCLESTNMSSHEAKPHDRAERIVLRTRPQIGNMVAEPYSFPERQDGEMLTDQACERTRVEKHVIQPRTHHIYEKTEVLFLIFKIPSLSPLAFDPLGLGSASYPAWMMVSKVQEQDTCFSD